MEKNNEVHGSGNQLLPFDPIILIRDVVKQWAAIVLIALSVGVAAFILTDMRYEPSYQSKTTFVVTARGGSSNVYNNLSSTTEMAAVFSELINSSIMRKNIMEEMGTGYVNATISAVAVPETNLLNMTVTAPDPRTAFVVAQTIIDHHEDVTYQVVDNVSLEVLKGAEVARSPMNHADAAGAMKKMTILAGLATCMLFAGISYMRDMVRSGQEARKKLDCNYLGELPHEEKYKTLLSRIRRRKTGILVANPVTSFHFVETMRKLSHRIEQHMGEGKVLMVTSLKENEGKSTLTVNLALTMARKNKVLLIECDLRKPSCAKLLDVKPPLAGTQTVLTDFGKLPDALVRYKKTQMYMILEKRGFSNSGDLLSSENLARLLEWAREEFDYVILDLPPMNVVSDAEIVSNVADAALLVVRQNVAKAAGINRAIADLENGKAKLLGCVLNDVRSSALFSGNGYRYGSYSGYGGYGPYHGYEDKGTGYKKG